MGPTSKGGRGRGFTYTGREGRGGKEGEGPYF